MKAEYINPFIKSLVNTFDTMVGCQFTQEEIKLKEGSDPKYEISGVIGLSGNAEGTVVLNISREVALKAASTMLMTELTEIDEDVIDAIGELTNMIAGSAKGELEGYSLSVSLPSVITGRDHHVNFSSKVPPISVSFSSDWGPLVLEVGLTSVAEVAEV